MTLYEKTQGGVAEITDFLNGKFPAWQEIDLSYEQGTALASAAFGRVLVSRQQIDLFAAQLYAAVGAGQVPRQIYDDYVETFGANAGTFIGN